MALATILAAIIGGILNRLRGGAFSNINRAIAARLEAAGNTGRLYKLTSWLSRQRTQIMRLIWSIPTAALFAWTLGLSWLVTLELAVSTFVGLAALGHGAHMVFDSRHFIENSKGKTELLTGFWLPAVFGGIPDSTWSHSRVTAYNLVGMSTTGLARDIITAAPLAFAGEPIAAAIYAASGLMHGPFYWLGWRIRGTQDTGEIVVGAASYALIVNL